MAGTRATVAQQQQQQAMLNFANVPGLDPSFNAAATKAFFKDEMELDDALIDELKADGVVHVVNMKDKTKDDWYSIRKSIQRDVTVAAHFGDHSLKRLIVASDAVRYCLAVGRDITPTMMKWSPILEHFKEGMEAIKALKAMPDLGQVPKLSKSFGPLKWTPAFISIMETQFGVQEDPPVPLSYLFRDLATPPAAPALEPDTLHGVGSSYLEELTARMVHKGPKFKSDNNLGYNKMEVATRGSEYHSTVTQYPRKGRSAYFALKSQHLGNDKWLMEVKKNDASIRTTIWTGNGNFTLEAWIAMHRRCYNALVEAALHVKFQLPTGYTRVTYLLDNIRCNDPDIAAAKASVTQDKDLDGKRENFEKAATCLQEACPVAKRRAATKRPIADVSSTQVQADISALNPGRGKSGVEFRYHTPEEYKKLNKAMKEDLRIWRTTPAGQAAKAAGQSKKKSKQNSNKNKGSGAFEKGRADVIAQLASIFGEGGAAPAPAPVPAPAPAPALKPPPGAAVTPEALQAAMAMINRGRIGALEALRAAGAESPSVPEAPTVARPFPTLPDIMRHLRNPGKKDGSPGGGF